MCLDLRTGSVVIGIVRLIHWLLILSSMAYIWAQIFIMQNGGMFHLKARTNIEKNSYVLWVVFLVSLVGCFLEPLMCAAVIRVKQERFIRMWFWLAGFTVTGSAALALSFLLHNLDIIKIDSNWFSDALCVLADLVFFYVPMYMLGPRLEPILTALLILAHMVLPIVHGAAFYVVYSYYKTPRIILPADAGGMGNVFISRQGTPTAPGSDHLDRHLHSASPGSGLGKTGKKLCHKCALKESVLANGGTMGGKNNSTPLLYPEHGIVETTC